MSIKVHSDNTQCEKAMEEVRVNLIFRCNLRATDTGYFDREKTKEIGPLKVFKALGQAVPAKQNFSQTINFTLPTTLEKGYCPWGYYMPDGQGEVSANQRAMLQMPCPTYDGFAMKSMWTLQVLHKHNSWNEFGDGIPIEFPITINQQSMSGE